MSAPGWSIVAVLALAGWLLCAIGLATSAFPRRGELVVSAALRWGGALLGFFAVWIMALGRA